MTDTPKEGREWPVARAALSVMVQVHCILCAASLVEQFIGRRPEFEQPADEAWRAKYPDEDWRAR